MSVRVLLVDDNAAFLEATVERLKLRGMEVDGAESGEAAVELVEQKLLDVAVIDLAMPVMDGVQTLEAIKQIQPYVQAIMLTGHGTVDSALKAGRLDAIEFFAKPCHVDDLTAAIERGLQRKRRLQKEAYLEEFEELNQMTSSPRQVLSESRRLRQKYEQWADESECRSASPESEQVSMSVTHRCGTAILFCMDFRLRQHLQQFISDHGLQAEGTDIIRVAGATKNLARPRHERDRWFVLDQLWTAYRLHHARRFCLINHEDCGAYGPEDVPDTAQELDVHRRDLLASRDLLRLEFKDADIEAYFMWLDGRADKVGGVQP